MTVRARASLALALVLMLPLISVVSIQAGESASEPPPGTWDYLPLAAYAGEDVAFSLRPREHANAWSAHDDGAVALGIRCDGAVLQATVNARAGKQVTFVDTTAGSSALLSVRMLAPGTGVNLRRALDGRHRLQQDGVATVLVPLRVEAESDRRWAMLDWFSHEPSEPCDRELADDAPAGDGLIGLVCASQALDLHGHRLLLRLPGSDRLASWKLREYRQILAWLIADALTRGAAGVVLVEPIGPAADEPRTLPLRLQARDAAAAYHCPLVPTSALAHERYWEIAPDVLGPALNERGCSALDRSLAEWRTKR